MNRELRVVKLGFGFHYSLLTIHYFRFVVRDQPGAERIFLMPIQAGLSSPASPSAVWAGGKQV